MNRISFFRANLPEKQEKTPDFEEIIPDFREILPEIFKNQPLTLPRKKERIYYLPILSYFCTIINQQNLLL